MVRKRMNSRRKLYVSGLIAVLLMVLLAAVYVVGGRMEQNSYGEERAQSSENFGAYETRSFQGQEWIRRSNQTVMLLMGTDRESGQRVTGFRSGGQADFLMLLVMDHNEKTILPLQLDRDTMTAVQTLGVLGNPTGAREMQLCLAHGFGRTEEDCCLNTLRAVSELLGEEIKLYASFDMASMALMNDALGGVEVTLEDDFTAFDPAMASGTTLRLTGEQAAIYLRQRLEVGEGTNEARMARHRQYITGAAEIIRTRMAQSGGYINQLLNQLENHMTTNLSRGRMINEANRAYRYQVLDTQTLPGEHRVGSDGFVEFHLASQAVEKWVMQALYRPAK